MKKMALLLCTVFAWICLFSGTPAVVTPAELDVIHTADASGENTETAGTAVRDARLVHMLELNRVFGDDLYNEILLAEEAATVLLDRAEESESGFMFVENSLVENLVFDLYGRVVDVAQIVYEGFPAEEGKMLILPRGGADITHTIVTVTEGEDDTLTVLSCMTITPHDGEVYSVLASTRFCESGSSPFGYIITAAEILG